MATPPPLPPRSLEYAPKEPRPWWVEMGLWGIPARWMAVAWIWVSVAAAVLTGIYWTPWGWGLLGAAVMYWLCLRWVDRYGTWKT